MSDTKQKGSAVMIEIFDPPTVDTDKCTGCGMCVISCGRSVFDFGCSTTSARHGRVRLM